MSSIRTFLVLLAATTAAYLLGAASAAWYLYKLCG